MAPVKRALLRLSSLQAPTAFNRAPSIFVRDVFRKTSIGNTNCFRSVSSEAFHFGTGEVAKPFEPQTASPSSSVKSVDDFSAPNIFMNGVPFFSETGMATFRVIPAMFKKTERGNFMTEFAGTLYITFYPHSEVETTKFDTKKSVRLRIRATDIGSILEIEATKFDKDTIIPAMNGCLQLSRGASPGTLRIKGIPRKRLDDTPEFVEVDVTTGQFRTLQTVLTHASPALFGWQVLLDPRLVANFMDPLSVKASDDDKVKEERLAFFD